MGGLGVQIFLYGRAAGTYQWVLKSVARLTGCYLSFLHFNR